ncbi:MAG TPA: hypothetical protein VM899_15235 [Rubellimicrobium sp.]|nr:hypothetical protein [Rubellimicrobium sp.]
MRTTILMAGLLAGLTGAAALAQTATPDATAPAQADPATPDAGSQPPTPDELRDMMGEMREMMDRMGAMPGMGDMGPRGDRADMGRMGDMGPGGLMDGIGPMDGPPNVAPLALSIYDTDGDGRITAEEIEARKAARFAAADADGDSGLSAEELVSLEQAIRQEVEVARAETRLQRFDDNGDGLLQAEEIEARTPRLAPIFDRLDTDGDGGITQEELDAGQDQRGAGPGGFFGRIMGGHGRHGG